MLFKYISQKKCVSEKSTNALKKEKIGNLTSRASYLYVVFVVHFLYAQNFCKVNTSFLDSKIFK